MRVAVIGCGAAKLSRPAPARELYRGPLFRDALGYAEAQAFDPILVLSAKYGLIELGHVIAPYELHLEALAPGERAELGALVRADLRRRAPTSGVRLTILAGELYAELLRPLAEEASWRIDEPLRGLMLGQRLQWFARRRREAA